MHYTYIYIYIYVSGRAANPLRAHGQDMDRTDSITCHNVPHDTMTSYNIHHHITTALVLTRQNMCGLILKFNTYLNIEIMNSKGFPVCLVPPLCQLLIIRTRDLRPLLLLIVLVPIILIVLVVIVLIVLVVILLIVLVAILLK